MAGKSRMTLLWRISEQSFCGFVEMEQFRNGLFQLGSGKENCTSLLDSNMDHDFSRSMASSFVKKLFDMVENEPDDIISWVLGGTAFEVKDPKRLGQLLIYLLNSP